jgi:hypothetical protein
VDAVVKGSSWGALIAMLAMGGAVHGAGAPRRDLYCECGAAVGAEGEDGGARATCL